MTEHEPRFSYRFKVEYRIKSGFRMCFLEVVAPSFGEAAHIALNRMMNRRGVIKVDRMEGAGTPIQCSGN